MPPDINSSGPNAVDARAGITASSLGGGKNVQSIIRPISVFILFVISCGGLAFGQDAPKGKTTSIPLESAFSTTRQDNMKKISRTRDQGEKYVNDLKLIYEYSYHVGASNIFLVRGNSIAEAIRATRQAFAGANGVDEPVNPDEKRQRGEFWLVAYLGVSGSEPPACVVTSIEKQGNRFRLTYERKIAETQDIYQYFVWVPLGSLSDGRYSLELAERQDAIPILVRNVPVRKVSTGD